LNCWMRVGDCAEAILTLVSKMAAAVATLLTNIVCPAGLLSCSWPSGSGRAGAREVRRSDIGPGRLPNRQRQH